MTPAPNTVVQLTTSYGSSRFARVILVAGITRLLGADGQILVGERLTGPRATVISWRAATAQEAADFDVTLQAHQDADRVTLYGAARFVRKLDLENLAGPERDDRICECISMLRTRNKPGAASQLAAYRFADGPGRYSGVESEVA